MAIVTSLYICISYNYTYSYNFYYLSSLHAYCMSTFFPLPILCLWHIFYLYFYCIPILLIFLFYDLLHSMYYYLYQFLDCLYHVLFHVVATRPCYTFHSSFSYLYYRILSCTFGRSYSIIYFVLSDTFCTFLVCIISLFFVLREFLSHLSYLP